MKEVGYWEEGGFVVCYFGCFDFFSLIEVEGYFVILSGTSLFLLVLFGLNGL